MTSPTRGTTTGPESVEPVPCAAFERTLLLLDGALTGRALESAKVHASGCSVCGPLVAGWKRTSDCLAAHLEDAAERAKPELVNVADRVFARIDAEELEPVEEPSHSVLRRFFFQLKPWLVLGAAAAAIAFSVGPLLLSDGSDEVSVASAPGAAPNTAPAIASSVESGDEASVADEAPTDVIVRKLSFDGADGMVYRTEGDGMTVIWINEHEEA